MNLNKKGGVIVVIGQRGEGKTPFIKKLLEMFPSKNVVGYDPRHEYSMNFNRDEETKYTLFHKFQYFKEKINELKNSFILIEEATGVLSAFKDIEFSEFMTSAEHNNCTQIYTFHSAMDAPQYILRNCNFIVLFNTGDDLENIRTQRKKLFPYLEGIKNGSLEKPFVIKNQ